MANVDGRADRALTGIEIGSDCIEGSVFHDHDQHGGSDHRRQYRVLEPVRKMLGLHEKAEGALGSNGYLPHGLPSKRPRLRTCWSELGSVAPTPRPAAFRALLRRGCAIV